jgi:hypothetical protein
MAAKEEDVKIRRGSTLSTHTHTHTHTHTVTHSHTHTHTHTHIHADAHAHLVSAAALDSSSHEHFSSRRFKLSTLFLSLARTLPQVLLWRQAARSRLSTLAEGSSSNQQAGWSCLDFSARERKPWRDAEASPGPRAHTELLQFPPAPYRSR